MFTYVSHLIFHGVEAVVIKKMIPHADFSGARAEKFDHEEISLRTHFSRLFFHGGEAVAVKKMIPFADLSGAKKLTLARFHKHFAEECSHMFCISFSMASKL